MKLKINLEDLKYCELSHPTTVPVRFMNKVVGEAIIDHTGHAEVSIKGEEEWSKIQHLMQLGVGGVVTSRDKDTVTGFSLVEVSIIPKTL